MLKVIVTIVCSVLLTPLLGEDSIILKTGEFLPCEILWEKPDKYKVRILRSSLVQVYGHKKVVEKKDVNIVRDHGGHRAMKGFGKVSITLLDGSRKITGGLYATTPTSIILISSQYKTDGKRSVHTQSTSITKIEKIRWRKSQALTGAVAGAAIGLAGGIYAGKEIYEVNDSESKGDYVLPAIALTAAGTGLGALLGHALSTRVKLKINGNLSVWTQERHRLPP